MIMCNAAALCSNVTIVSWKLQQKIWVGSQQTNLPSLTQVRCLFVHEIPLDILFCARMYSLHQACMLFIYITLDIPIF